MKKERVTFQLPVDLIEKARDARCFASTWCRKNAII